MPNPVFITVPADTWYKVAENVKFGWVHTLNPTDNQWYQTYVVTGAAAPTEEPEVKLVFPSDEINSTFEIDVYLYHKKTAGRVRVDI